MKSPQPKDEDQEFIGIGISAGTVQAHSGALVDVLNPNPGEIFLEDIAAALSKLCRWNGHCHSFYSVAEHCIMASRLADPQHRRAALLHDAAEAYIGDLPRPIKAAIPQFKDIEHRLMEVISHKFNFQYPLPEQVKVIDDILVNLEGFHLLPDRPTWVSIDWKDVLTLRADELLRKGNQHIPSSSDYRSGSSAARWDFLKEFYRCP